MNIYHSEFRPLFIPISPVCRLDYVNAALGDLLSVLAALIVLFQPHRAAVVIKLQWSLTRAAGFWPLAGLMIHKVTTVGVNDVDESHTLSFCVCAARPTGFIMAMKIGMSPRGLPTPPAMLIPRVSLGPLMNSTVLVSWCSGTAWTQACVKVFLFPDAASHICSMNHWRLLLSELKLGLSASSRRFPESEQDWEAILELPVSLICHTIIQMLISRTSNLYAILYRSSTWLHWESLRSEWKGPALNLPISILIDPTQHYNKKQHAV